MGNYRWEIGGIETTDGEARLIPDTAEIVYVLRKNVSLGRIWTNRVFLLFLSLPLFLLFKIWFTIGRFYFRVWNFERSTFDLALDLKQENQIDSFLRYL